MNKHLAIRPARTAFSLIELLAVIAVIVILVGIVFIGMNYVTGSSRQRSTKTTLGNLQSMLSAYDAQSRGALEAIGLEYAKTITGTATPSKPYPALPLPDSDANVTIPQYAPPAALPTPSASAGFRYGAFVCMTGNLAMAKILSLPENRAALGKLPTKMLPAVPSTTTNPSNILLDAWGNPIIYVPATGLAGVRLKADASKYYLVRSNGTTAYATYASPPTPTTSARPFFASAGPDGDFAKGDDNVYSFEQ